MVFPFCTSNIAHSAEEYKEFDADKIDYLLRDSKLLGLLPLSRHEIMYSIRQLFLT